MPNFGASHILSFVLLLTVSASVAHSQSSYVCPKRFVAIAKKCYHFSKDEASWLDAHFKCRSLNSSLAIVNKPQQELELRRYLNRRNDGKYRRWLGGRYNEKQSRWVWGENGKPLLFHAFSRMNSNDRKWAWHCIIADPDRQNKWGGRTCVENQRYICQRSALGRRKYNRKRCLRLAKNTESRELCLKQDSINGAPAFLIKKPQTNPGPFHIATFVCPPHMILVGRKCYFFSLDDASWGDAYWACRDNKTKLAVVTTRMQDNILRGFLRAKYTVEKHERWLGGIYDWKQGKWKWAMSGKLIRYQNFAKEASVLSKNNTHNCITLDPQFDNLWNSKNRLDRKHYICQAKSKSVVKYDKPLKPEATLIIALKENTQNGTDELQEKDLLTETLNSKHNNEVTEKYIYN